MTAQQTTLAAEPRRRPRCSACRLPAAECICAALPRIAIPLSLVMFQHAQERKSGSNTGCLVERVFESCIVVPHGGEGARAAPGDWPQDVDHAVLFPSPGAPAISPASFPERPGRGRALIILDATWPQARRMSRRLPGLRRFPFLALPAGPPAERALRRPVRAGDVGTAEAVARALAALGFESAAELLADAVALQAERALRLRGRVGR